MTAWIWASAGNVMLWKELAFSTAYDWSDITESTALLALLLLLSIYRSWKCLSEVEVREARNSGL